MDISKKIVGNIIGSKRFGGKNDWDFDGVTNKKDCQPRNTMRQDTVFEDKKTLGYAKSYGFKPKKRYRIYIQKNVRGQKPEYLAVVKFPLSKEYSSEMGEQTVNKEVGGGNTPEEARQDAMRYLGYT